MYIPISPGKVEMIDATIAAYKATGQLMVALVNGRLSIPGSPDEMGLYYFIPLLATRLNMTGGPALALFQWAVLVVATSLGVLISLRLFTARESRVFAIMGFLGIATLAFGVGDVYMIAPMFIAGVVPSALYLVSRGDENRILVVMATIGFFAAVANFVSQFASVAGITFVIALIAASRHSRKSKLWFGAALAAGYLMATAMTQVSIGRRDDLIRVSDPAYEAPARMQGFWVKTYLGLGFVTNPYVSEYRNDVAAEKLKSLAPGTTIAMPGAERLLRSEVLSIVGAHPWFAVRTIAAKLGVVFIYLFVFVTAAQLARVRPRKGESVGGTFAIAGAVAVLPGLLWLPSVENLSAAIALAVIYATYTIARARDHSPVS